MWVIFGPWTPLDIVDLFFLVMTNFILLPFVVKLILTVFGVGVSIATVGQGLANG